MSLSLLNRSGSSFELWRYEDHTKSDSVLGMKLFLSNFSQPFEVYGSRLALEREQESTVVPLLSS